MGFSKNLLWLTVKYMKKCLKEKLFLSELPFISFKEKKGGDGTEIFQKVSSMHLCLHTTAALRTFFPEKCLAAVESFFLKDLKLFDRLYTRSKVIFFF